MNDYHVWSEQAKGKDPILTIRCDAATAKRLRKDRKEREDFQSDAFMWDVLEPVWTNGLTQCEPQGLNDAPTLCEYLADDGRASGRIWAYMSSVRSVLDDLADHRKAVWEYGGVGVSRLTDVIVLLEDAGVVKDYHAAVAALEEYEFDVERDIPDETWRLLAKKIKPHPPVRPGFACECGAYPFPHTQAGVPFNFTSKGGLT
jgi:hypothetical protein